MPIILKIRFITELTKSIVVLEKNFILFTITINYIFINFELWKQRSIVTYIIVSLLSLLTVQWQWNINDRELHCKTTIQLQQLHLVTTLQTSF